MSDMYKRIRSDIIRSMKEKTITVKTVLRCLDSDLQLKAKESKKEIDDDMVVTMLKKHIKQRHASIVEFTKGNRPDLVKQEALEIVVLEFYMPEMMSKSMIEAIVLSTIEKMGATTPKDMGKVMEALSKYKNETDMKMVSTMVRTKLQGA